MAANRRQLALLGAIVLVLAVVLYWQSTSGEVSPEEFSAAMSRPPDGAPATAFAAPGAARPRALGPIPAVELGSLDRAQPEPADTGRDPFRFGAAAPRPRESGPAPGGAAPVTAPAVPMGPAPPPPPPPIPLKFIGIARQGEGRLYAVLRDDRGIYYGADGDIVEGRYRILRVTTEIVEVSYLDGRGRVSLPLTGGRP